MCISIILVATFLFQDLSWFTGNVQATQISVHSLQVPSRFSDPFKASELYLWKKLVQLYACGIDIRKRDKDIVFKTTSHPERCVIVHFEKNPPEDKPDGAYIIVPIYILPFGASIDDNACPIYEAVISGDYSVVIRKAIPSENAKKLRGVGAAFYNDDAFNDKLAELGEIDAVFPEEYIINALKQQSKEVKLHMKILPSGSDISVCLFNQEEEVAKATLGVRNTLRLSRIDPDLPFAEYLKRDNTYYSDGGRCEWDVIGGQPVAIKCRTYHNLNPYALIDIWLHESLRGIKIKGRSIAEIWFRDRIEPYLKDCGFNFIAIEGTCWDYEENPRVRSFWRKVGFKEGYPLNHLYNADTVLTYFSIKPLEQSGEQSANVSNMDAPRGPMPPDEDDRRAAGPFGRLEGGHSEKKETVDKRPEPLHDSASAKRPENTLSPKETPGQMPQIYQAPTALFSSLRSGLCGTVRQESVQGEPEGAGVAPKVPSPEIGRYLGDITDAERLASRLVVGMESYLHDNKKLTIMIRDNLGGDDFDVVRFKREIDKWKRKTVRHYPRLKKPLDGLTVELFADETGLRKKILGSKNIEPDESKKNTIFVFDRQEHAGLGDAVKSVVIEESGSFKGYYYPLFEIITISLSKELLGVEKIKLVKEALKESDVNIERLNIKDIRDGNESGAFLIFTLLPKTRRYDINEQADRNRTFFEYIRSA